MNKFLLSFLFAFFTLFSSFTNAQCAGDDPLISQVAEGSSNNKAVELYNPSTGPLDLSLYQLVRYANGNATGTSIALSGMLAPGEVYVLANPSADAAILAIADQESGTISHNGNDHYVLELIADGSVIDSYGDVGNTSTFGANQNMERVLTPGMPCPYDTDISDDFDPAAYSSEAYSTGLPTGLGDAILPIELKSFRVVATNDIVNLNWVTINEIDNSHFNILHSTNGFTFRTIGQVDGAGFSTEELEYSFEFRNAINGKNYFQLEQVDFNGDSEKFNIEVVTIEKGNDIKIFPSTADSKITVEGIDSDSNYTIYTITGQSIQTGITSGSINVDNLYNGSYFIQVNGTTLKFFKN